MAPRTRPRAVRCSRSELDQIRTDAAAGVPARRGEGREGDILIRRKSKTQCLIGRERRDVMLCWFPVSSSHQELGIRQPLHRKKLQLALQALGSDEDDLKGRLDHNWVTSECPITPSTCCLSAATFHPDPTHAVFLCFRMAGRHRPPSVQEPLR